MAQENGKGPGGRLKAEARGLADAVAERAMSSVRDKVESTAGKLTSYATGQGSDGLKAAASGVADVAQGKSPVRSMLGAGASMAKDKVSGMLGGGGGGSGGGGQKLKVTNIVESIEVGVPIRVAYNQWTQFADFPTFMKKVENVDQSDDTTANWKAQVFWSHRAWEATITDQRPDERIIWHSEGEKGHVDGAITFHELAPALTKVVVVLEYHPKGLFEHTGNLWRAQGRRVRLELKHFQRHVMSTTLLDQDEAEGWRGVIEDGEVVKDHETAVAEEREQEGAADAGSDNDATEDKAASEEKAARGNGSRRKRPAEAARSGRAPQPTRPSGSPVRARPATARETDKPSSAPGRARRAAGHARRRGSAMTTATQAGGPAQPSSSSSGLADVIDIILDKGLVIDAYVRVSLVGIELITIDARIVIASVDTYLRFAEAVNRLDITQDKKDLPGLVGDLEEGGAKKKTKGALDAAGDKLRDFAGDGDDERGSRRSRHEGG